MNPIRKLLSATTAVLLLAVAVRADDIAEAGRRIYEKNQDAVVTIKAVIKVSGSGGGMSINQQEQRVETTGTIVDPSGLTLTSYTIMNPANAIRSNIKRMMTQRGMPPTDVDINSEVASAKIILSDGTEINAEVVLRDEDLDVAFLRPTEKPAKPFPCVSLADNPTVQLFDPVVTLNRLGNIAKRTLAMSSGRIEARVQKPRLFYSVSAAITGSPLGGPVFTLDGKLIGLILVRKSVGDDAESGLGGNPSGLLPVLTPVSELGDSIKQALTATPKKEEKKAKEK